MQDKNPLFEYLDRCGIGFRQSMSELINTYGSRNCGWTENLDYCEVQGELPFINGLAHPLVFQFTGNADLLLPSNHFKSYLRGSVDCKENYELAVSQLTSIFGDGKDSSTSNTISSVWDFGISSITARVFPPELNGLCGRNSRHTKIRNSRNECTISIELNWARQVTKVEYAWLSSYKPFYNKTISEVPFRFMPGHTYCWPEKLESASLGFGFDENQQVLINVSENSLVSIVPVCWIVGVVRSSLLPAKAGAEASVSIQYMPSGQAEIGPQFLTLLSRKGDPFVFNSLAIELSKKLKVKLLEHESPNC